MWSVRQTEVTTSGEASGSVTVIKIQDQEVAEILLITIKQFTENAFFRSLIPPPPHFCFNLKPMYSVGKKL